MGVVKFLQGDSWLKHPVHPALVTLPIGMWIFSAIMDGVALATNNKCTQEAADDAVVGGLIGAGLAASAGVAEFLRVPTGGGAVNDAVTHGALNTSAAALYGVNAAMRASARKNGRSSGVIPKLLSLIGVGALAYSGWLGGTLAYNHGVGVSLNQAIEDHQLESSEKMKEQEKEEQELRASM